MCSRPASPNCPGSLFTSIRHFPPVIVANAHCTPLMIGEHTREKKPFYNSIFFHRRPYRLKLPLPRSDNSFALLAPTGFLHRVYSGLIKSAMHLLFHPLFWQLYFLSRTTRTRTLQCKLTKYNKVLRTPICVHVYDQFCKVLNRTELCKVAWKLPRTWLYCLTLTCALKMIYKQIVWSLWENEYLSCVTCFLT